MDTSIDNELIERILLDLENVFKKDSLIDEFDILPVHESTRNKSPVIHVHNKLALEDWCLKPFYIYVYNKFFAWKLKKIKVDSHTVLMWTKAILLINPEIETVWNARKELTCYISSELKASVCYTPELKFSELVLSRKPKSSPVFAHRKWALSKLKDYPDMPDIIKQEFCVCARVANLYPNNYYAWSHRTWIIQELLETCLKSVSEELTRTEPWVSTHISDHSGFHYRQFLLSCYRTVVPKLDSGNSSYCRLHQITNYPEEMENKKCFFHSTKIEQMLQFREAIQKEIAFISDLQNTYPGHETLWYHRRYLLHEIKLMDENKEICAIQLESLDGAVQNKKHKLEYVLSMNWNLAKEEHFLERIYKEENVHYTDKSWEKTLIVRHLKWLNKVLKWPISDTLS